MKHLMIVLCLLVTSKVYGLEVSINHAVFKSDSTHYVEIYTRFISNTLQFISDENTKSLQSSIEYLIYIKRDQEITVAEKYVINSPASMEASDFWDLKRYALSPGNYDVHLQCVDNYNVSDTLELDWTMEVQNIDDRSQASDVLLISKVVADTEASLFCKNSFCFEPLSYNLINKEQNELFAYLEYYDLSKEIDGDYYIQYYAQKIDSLDQKEFASGYEKRVAKPIEPILLRYDVKELPSGNYNFVIEIHRKDKSLVHAVERSFSVYHPFVDYKLQFKGDAKFETSFVQFLNQDELDYALKAIYPRVGNHHTETLNLIIKSDEIQPKRYFLHHFWTGFSEQDPRSIYDKYMNVVKAIDIRYANNVGHGFETDRGYYFLKYGRPDDLITVEDEPSAPPYEIWIYNYMPETGESNVRFLFYNPSLSANDFVLLHSTCRGERNNPRWEVDLYSDDFNATNTNYIDARRVNDGFNRNARFYFSDAR